MAIANGKNVTKLYIGGEQYVKLALGDNFVINQTTKPIGIILYDDNASGTTAGSLIDFYTGGSDKSTTYGPITGYIKKVPYFNEPAVLVNNSYNDVDHVAHTVEAYLISKIGHTTTGGV